MSLKKTLAFVLAFVMAFGFIAIAGFEVKAEGEVAVIDWEPYDQLIADIKAETDLAVREQLMHQAEDMLMDTWALIPLYYYNDLFMMSEELEGVYATLTGEKFFMFASMGDADTLRINLSSEPARLDPHLNSSVDGAVLAVNSFSGLYTYDAAGELVPDLAEATEISEDGLTYVFTLKEGLKWSDGSDLDASDFEYSWKRAAAAETAADYAYMLNVIEGYPDEMQVPASEAGRTLTVVLNAPTADFLDLASFPTYLPVHQETVESAEGFKDGDGNVLDPGAWATEAGFISNGAYTLEEWAHNESMRYVKNPNYHRADEVVIETLEFMLTADDTVVLSAYEAGDLDFIDTVPSAEIPNLIERPDFHLVNQLGTYYVIFNVKSELFAGKTEQQAKDMRQALSLLIDREYIVEAVAQTGQQIATSFIPAEMADGHGGVFKANDDDFTFPIEDGYLPIEPDPDQAIALLEGAGYVFEDGVLSADTPLAFEYLTNDTSAHKAIAEIMQQDFAAYGITMDIRPIEWDTFLAERKDGNYDVARNGWIADFNDPINMLEMWSTVSGNIDAQFGK